MDSKSAGSSSKVQGENPKRAMPSLFFRVTTNPLRALVTRIGSSPSVTPLSERAGIENPAPESARGRSLSATNKYEKIEKLMGPQAVVAASRYQSWVLQVPT